MATFTNQAVLTYNGVTRSSNIVTGEITQGITAWKDATYDRYQSGDILTYVVNIQNSGADDLSGLTITDDLGAYALVGGTEVVPLTYTGDPVLYFINGILQTTPAVTEGPPLVINGISVPAGLNAAIIYRVVVNEFAPIGTDGEIENTATIRGSGLSSDVTATETVTAIHEANLTIFKLLSPTTVVENGELTYTLTIQNTGSVAAGGTGSDLVIRDAFDPILETPLSVSLNGTPWAMAGNYTYNPSTGEFATVAGRLTVPAATFVQDSVTGAWTVTPGVTVLTITGRI